MSLDSRALTHLDCYAKRFTAPGQVAYQLLAGSGACAPEEEAGFTIEVGRKAAGEGRQYDVEVRFTAGALMADPPRLEIQPGDMVLWHAADSSVPGFTVRGTLPGGGEFDSGALAEEAVFTHAFGLAGRYEWTDARGGAVSGVVEVVAPEGKERSDCDRWVKALAEGALIHVVKGKARPDQVRILPGQTVFWAVESAPGISITDKRLLS